MLADQVKNRCDVVNGDLSAPFFSLEFFPPQRDTPKSVADFFDTLNYLKQSNPLFIDITWSRRNDPGNLAKISSSSAIAIATKELFCRTMLHICCNDHTKEETVAHVQQAMKHGIRNIMALRGDDLPGEMQNAKNGQITSHYAIDLVKWIREMEAADGKKGENGQRLTVAVAGHMFSPLKSVTYTECMDHLKKKVDAGADFIVTQFFLDVELFEKFCDDCRAKGIRVPILPGILLFKSVAALKKMADLANVPIPDKVAMVLDVIGGDPVAVQNYAVQLAYDMSRHILSTHKAAGIHFFTLNQRDMCGKLLRRLGFWPTVDTEPRLVNGELKQILNGTAAKEQQQTDEQQPIIGTKLPLVNGHVTASSTRTTA